jgi:sugar phosphate isomerase/epimerase
MIVKTGGEHHLTYCLNVHPGETWEDNFDAIRRHALTVRERVNPGRAFGLGLRLSARATDTLWGDDQRVEELLEFLAEHDLYVFTVNGFPYGDFHGTRVKERVYAPDWRSEERVTYTNRLADVLARLLPQGAPGSISSVPGSYRQWVNDGGDVDAICRNLAACVRHLAALEERTGRHIALALEPEPDCLFDTTSQTVAFFTGVLPDHPAIRELGSGWESYLGVCLDTCHLSVVFDDPAEGLKALSRQGISIPKIQVSAALRAVTGEETAEQLRAFAEGTYLHQVRLRDRNGIPHHYPDLTETALARVACEDGGEVRVHVHVPLYVEASGVLGSTGNDLTPAFFRAVDACGVPHVEIETYTFGVLPEALASLPVEESIAREYEWVLERLEAQLSKVEMGTAES